MYSIQQLKKELVYITWDGSPRAADYAIEERFIRDLRTTLDEAAGPVYVLSDLRRGRISNMKTIQRLAELTRHPNYAGSTAFSGNLITNILVGTFSRFSVETQPKDAIWKTPEEVLAYLELLQKGVTQNIDWNALLNPSDAER
ncbi:MAG: hypothetical protein AAFR22_05220 [Chloroflexota bacterium]